MDVHLPTPLLGGLSPRQFMKRHWQRKPLLVRGAVPGMQPIADRGGLFALATRDEVESRLVEQRDDGRWSMRRGPFTRRALPPLARPRWTLLVQGVDLHVDAAHQLLQRFRFVPEARLDDLMVSWASDGGGVGPHFDSYDVFLLQAQGRRRWRFGKQQDLTLQEGVPLKILEHFEPQEEYVLEPGDMLYLPPRYAHEGIAEGECQTYSIGFRAPRRGELARELLLRLSEDAAEAAGEAMYRDAGQCAVREAGAIPAELERFAQDALKAALKDPHALARALGEYLSEPKPNVWFDAGPVPRGSRPLQLDRRTRMLYDGRHLFINGESWRASGPDARLMRKLADERRLGTADLARASDEALELLASWCEAGWMHEEER
jgi:50S ribosomal protein L16 3-hydroxylase